ncbi:DNA mismatch repair endonuclease MutL [Chloroflexota bacterium]
MPIRILEKKLISQIAAGEVVERPSSVVKELVENALDAGSSQISVEVKGGGINLIRVTDNGGGIPSSEVELAFRRYATSKIGKLEDLQFIDSLGFRGEALPGIAAVAQVDMVTCASGEAVGTHLGLEDEAIVRKERQGRDRGTTIAVRNLFAKVPARLKFLKSVSTESSHIANVVSQYALAFPEIRFTLYVDGKQTLTTPGRGRLIDSVLEVYSTEIAQNMLELGGAEQEWQNGTKSIEVTGMVGSPAVSRSGRGYLSFFINRRWVSSRLLSWAVEEAYHGLLMVGKHPVAVINISLPLPEVDVNIHPAKSEVKFQNEKVVFSAVQRAVRRALMEQMVVSKVEGVTTKYMSSAGRDREFSLWNSVNSNQRIARSSPQASAPLIASLPLLRVVGQVMGSYIVAEGPDGLYLIDQHAAHERVRFEKIRGQRAQRDVEVQGLLEPVAFEVNPRQEEALKLGYQSLAEFGFSIEPFGGRTYLARAVPRLLGGGDWGVILRELLDSLVDEGGRDSEERIAATIACHGAIRFGQLLSDDEMRELVRQLEQAINPHTCPHGRPTIIHLSSAKLAQEFGRT